MTLTNAVQRSRMPSGKQSGKWPGNAVVVLVSVHDPNQPQCGLLSVTQISGFLLLGAFVKGVFCLSVLAASTWITTHGQSLWQNRRC